MNALTQPQRYLQAAQGLDATVFVSTPDYVSLYTQLPERWGYDMDPGTGISRATYLGEVFIGGTSALNQAATKGDIAAATTGVSSFNTRTGAVTLTTADVTGAGGAPQNSPTFGGVPNAPTAAPGTNTTQIATTMFVTAAIGAVTGAMVSSFNGRIGAINLTTGDITGAGGAPTASPALTGTPTAPTASAGNASSQIATTQFVSNAIAGAVVSWNGRTGAVSLSLSDVLTVGGAPINSPNFTGTPLVPTAAPNTATTQAASTAFVMNAITASTGGVATFNGRSGAVTLLLSDVTTVGGAPINSPVLTGTPQAPTPTGGDNSTKIATTAFVDNALASLGGVTTFNGRAGAVTLQLADVTSVGGAPLASPAFTGSPTTTTAPPGDNSTRVADTAYVIAALPQASTTTPNMDGMAAVGTGTTWARADHVHPSDTSKLSLTGGTLTGALVVNSTINATGNIQTGGSFGSNGTGANTFAGPITAPGSSTIGSVTFASGNVQGNNFTGNNLTIANIGNFGNNWAYAANSATVAGQNNAGLTALFAGNGTTAGSNTMLVRYDRLDGNLIIFYFGTTSLGAIAPSSGGTGVTYGSNSDARLKEAIAPIDPTDAARIMDALEPVQFHWITTPPDTPPSYGFIAQDAHSIFPDAVVKGSEAGEEFRAWQMDYAKLVPILAAEIKALRARVAALEGAVLS